MLVCWFFLTFLLEPKSLVTPQSVVAREFLDRKEKTLSASTNAGWRRRGCMSFDFQIKTRWFLL